MDKELLKDNLENSVKNLEVIKESVYYYTNCKQGVLHHIAENSIRFSIICIFTYTENYLKIVLNELTLGDYISDLDSSIDVALSRNLIDKGFSRIIKKNKNLQYSSITPNLNIEILIDFYFEIEAHYKKQIQLIRNLLG